MKQFELNPNRNKGLFVVDNFYADPHTVREIALTMDFQADLRYYKGLRTTQSYRDENIKRAFEEIIGEPITNWEYGINGCFQSMTVNGRIRF